MTVIIYCSVRSFSSSRQFDECRDMQFPGIYENFCVENVLFKVYI